MKLIFSFLAYVFFINNSTIAQVQWTSTITVNKDIEGLCDINNVYDLNLMEPFQQNQAVSAKLEGGRETVLKSLNEQSKFAKENLKFKAKMNVRFYINCNAELVHIELDKKTGNQELDKEIISILSRLANWQVGTLRNNSVDSSQPFYLQLKKGTFAFR